MENTPRIRVNAKQTSKGEYYFDCTAEVPEAEPLRAAQLCLDAAKAVEQKFASAGKKIVDSNREEASETKPKT